MLIAPILIESAVASPVDIMGRKGPNFASLPGKRGPPLPLAMNISSLVGNFDAVISADTPIFISPSTPSAVTSTPSPIHRIEVGVPKGWVVTTRTGAYAVRIIIGISIFLALLIFCMILILVRRAKKRKQRKRLGIRSQEEGNIYNVSNNVSFTGRNANRIQGPIDEMEKDEPAIDEKRKIRRITRLWGPTRRGGGIRRRRRKISGILNRSSTNTAESVLGAGASPDDLITEVLPEAHVSSIQSMSGSIRYRNTSATSVNAVLTSITNASLESTQSPLAPSIHTQALVENVPASPLSGEDSYSIALPIIGPPAYIPSPSSSGTSVTPNNEHESPSPCGGSIIPSFSSAEYEKHILAASRSTPAALASSGDVYREQRRYEHLYTSRENEEAERHQRTGAPHSFVRDSDISAASGSNLELEDAELDSRRLHGHIAMDDKAFLGSIRLAASAPGLPSATESSCVIASFSNHYASAPPLQDADDDEEYARANVVRQTASPANTSLPSPPQPIDGTFTSISDIPPLMDEKLRLRQAEQRHNVQLYGPSSPTIGGLAVNASPSAPPMSEELELYNSDAAFEHATYSKELEDDIDQQEVRPRPHEEGIV